MRRLLCVIALAFGCNNVPPEPDALQPRDIPIIVYEYRTVEADPCGGTIETAVCWQMVEETRFVMETYGLREVRQPSPGSESTCGGEAITVPVIFNGRLVEMTIMPILPEQEMRDSCRSCHAPER